MQICVTLKCKILFKFISMTLYSWSKYRKNTHWDHPHVSIGGSEEATQLLNWLLLMLAAKWKGLKSTIVISAGKRKLVLIGVAAEVLTECALLPSWETPISKSRTLSSSLIFLPSLGKSMAILWSYFWKVIYRLSKSSNLIWNPAEIWSLHTEFTRLWTGDGSLAFLYKYPGWGTFD